MWTARLSIHFVARIRSLDVENIWKSQRFIFLSGLMQGRPTLLQYRSPLSDLLYNFHHRSGGIQEGEDFVCIRLVANIQIKSDFLSIRGPELQHNSRSKSKILLLCNWNGWELRDCKLYIGKAV